MQSAVFNTHRVKTLEYKAASSFLIAEKTAEKQLWRI